jgi:hypothetical protein
MNSTLTFAARCTLAIAALGTMLPVSADVMKTSPQKSSAVASPWIVAKQKHTASGVTLRYRESGTVKSGQTATVSLVLAGITAAEGAQIEIKTSDPAMVVLRDGNPVNAPIFLPAGGQHRMDLTVANAPEGLHYVNIFMTQRGRTSVAGVPVKVGDGQSRQKAEGQLETTPSGERIIVLPSAK